MRTSSIAPCARIVALLLAALLVLPSLASAQQAAVADDPVWSALRDSTRQPFADATAGRLHAYQIDAELTPANDTTYASIEGRVAIRWVNLTETVSNAIHFRLYPNDERYREGEMTITRATIDGERQPPLLSRGDTVASFDLPAGVEPGGSVDIVLRYTATIPNDAPGTYGMFDHDVATATYTLTHWYPMLAGYDPDSGYLLGPITVNGDPVFANAATYDVSLTAPAALVIATTGEEIDRVVDNDLATVRYVAGPAREFTLAASPSYEIVEVDAGDIRVRSFHLPGHDERGLAVARWTADALALYEERIGPYPYTELDVVDAPIGGGAAGIEFPGLIFIASGYYDEPLDQERTPRGQEYTLVHEVLHQWWYNVVGNNHYDHAFLDEALTNQLTTLYFLEIYGQEVFEQQVFLNLELPYMRYLYAFTNLEDGVVDQPSDDFVSATAYGIIIYCKGALGFMALMDTMGQDAYFAALATYYADHLFGIAGPADLLAALEHAAGRHLGSVWTHWFEETRGLEDFPRERYDEALDRLG